jgi:thiosulfate reductase cytochrome b subunit
MRQKAWFSLPLIPVALFTLSAAVILLGVFSVAIPVLAQQDPAAGEQKAAAGPKVESKEASGKEGAAEETAPAKKGKGEELSNSSCIECHNPDILKMSKEELADNVDVGDKPQPPKAKPAYFVGDLNLSIDEKRYSAGSHADTKCVECHQDIESIPHKQRLKAVDCSQCHEEHVEAIQGSAHGKKAAAKAPPCMACHDAHYGAGKKDYGDQWKSKACLDCHKANKMDVVAGHKNLYEAGRHMSALGCMTCHRGKQAGVHNIPPAKVAAASCESCHGKATRLSAEKAKPSAFGEYVTQTGFINKDVIPKYGYLIGANRIPALDLIVILVVLGPLALPLFHGGLRILTRRKGPIELPEEKILLHPLIERIWHWFQALCIVMLIITGIMLHWPEKFPGWFGWAVDIHNWFGWGAVIAFGVWLVYNLVTGRISHYFPKKGEIPGGMIAQAKFYGYGIFKHDPHPYAPSENNKFNPLQKIAYLQFQILFLPLLLFSGLVYMYPEMFKGLIDAIGGKTVLAVIHYLLGALFAAFLVAHIYLATTGETIGENFKAIVFGYGIKSDHGDEHKHV